MRRAPLLPFVPGIAVARLALGGIALAALVLGASSCAWDPWTRSGSLPDPGSVAPSQALRLAPGESLPGEIECAEGFCQQWYRIDVAAPGTLRVEVTLGVAEPPRARAVLHDGTGRVLARANAESGTTLLVEAAVEAGPAALLVQSGRGRLPYTVSATLE